MYVSKIEQAIEQLQQCVDESKTKLLDNTKIIVDREEIQGHINELRKQAPEEIAYLRKIVDNRDAILRDAKEKAEALINKATAEKAVDNLDNLIGPCNHGSKSGKSGCNAVYG